MHLLTLRNRLLCAIGALAFHQACDTRDSPSTPPSEPLAGAGGAITAGTSALGGSAQSGAGSAQVGGASSNTTGGAGTQASSGKGGQTVQGGTGGAGAEAGASSGTSGQGEVGAIAGDGGTAGTGATAGSGAAGCGGTSSGQKECPPPAATEMPEPSDQWTPECKRVVSPYPEAPISNCCIDVACYMPDPSEPCKSHQEALSEGLIYLQQAYGSGFCDCSNKGAHGLEGPFFVPDGYPAHPVVKPGLCCYTSNYSECLGRPLRIESRERIARLQRDVFWG